ncbi:MAG: hypothetical protein RLY27_2332 [Pseudomonadota bacterium]|jgi:transcriptional regulator with XRE-family HTH domain
MEIATAFGLVLRDLRKEAGLTQEELGLDADLMRTFVSLLEPDQQKPNPETMFKLSKVINVDVSEIH